MIKVLSTFEEQQLLDLDETLQSVDPILSDVSRTGGKMEG